MIASPPPFGHFGVAKLLEYPETDPLFTGAERLGRLLGRSGRWVRQREAERMIERASLNGQNPRDTARLGALAGTWGIATDR